MPTRAAARTTLIADDDLNSPNNIGCFTVPNSRSGLATKFPGVPELGQVELARVTAVIDRVR